MSRAEMLWKLGMLLVAIGALLFAAWAVSAVILVQGWNPINEHEVQTGAEYTGALFRLPVLISFAAGVICLVAGFSLNKRSG